MPAKIIAYAIFPAVLVIFYAARVFSYDTPIDQWIPRWHNLFIIGTVVILERIYTYSRAVSQRHLLRRDILSSFVNMYLTGAVAGLILVPVLVFFSDVFLGHGRVFESSAQLGPLWLQVLEIVVLVSFFRYWMHRLQHRVPFLWELHSYHHRVTDLTVINTLVSHPIDFALRNVLIFSLLALIGFHPYALLLALPATLISGLVSHCAAEVRAGPLNYLFVTPEVHRWHHSATVPEGHKYAVNYGVEFSFWDILFGTFHLPGPVAHPEQPERIGHPAGLADEPSYLRLLLVPLGLYRPLRWFKRAEGTPPSA
jgi:sterol desaturase/sphingolipid hydroxylase (fatty acid hydroxylase superfamily)